MTDLRNSANQCRQRALQSSSILPLGVSGDRDHCILDSSSIKSPNSHDWYREVCPPYPISMNSPHSQVSDELHLATQRKSVSGSFLNDPHINSTSTSKSTLVPQTPDFVDFCAELSLSTNYKCHVQPNSSIFAMYPSSFLLDPSSLSRPILSELKSNQKIVSKTNGTISPATSQSKILNCSPVEQSRLVLGRTSEHRNPSPSPLYTPHQRANLLLHCLIPFLFCTSSSQFQRQSTSSALSFLLVVSCMFNCVVSIPLAASSSTSALNTQSRQLANEQTPIAAGKEDNQTPENFYYKKDRSETDPTRWSDGLSSKHIKLNAIKLKMLDHLKNNQQTYRVYHQRLTEPIFDPSLEELSIEAYDTRGAINRTPMQQIKNELNVYEKNTNLTDRKNSDDNKESNFKNGIVAHKLTLSIDDDDGDSMTEGHDNAMTNPKQTVFVQESNLSWGDQHQLIKNVIKSGWIEHSSTKTLQYFLKKVNYLLYNNEEHDNPIEAVGGYVGSMQDVNSKFNNEPMSPEEDLLVLSKKDDSSFGDRGRSNSMSSTLTKDFIQEHKNIEIVLERLMSTPNVVKKRGEGPQLSIDSPLAVLRQRLILELARRKAKQTEEQIAINTEILKKLGRRRRSIFYPKKQSEQKSSFKNIKRASRDRIGNKQSVNCDQVKCKLNDLNMSWSNVHDSLFTVAKKNQVPSVYNRPNGHNLKYLTRNRFRNNDKYFELDRSEDEHSEESDSESHLSKAYSNSISKVRVNSRKPSFGRLNEAHYKIESPSGLQYWRGWNKNDDWFNSRPRATGHHQQSEYSPNEI